LVTHKARLEVIKWSYSGLKDYVTCPRQYYEVKVAKNFFKRPTEQMLYGTAVHSALENYVGKGEPLKKNYERYRPMLDALLEIEGDRLPEYRMALNADLLPCDFYAQEYWVRGIVDLLIINDDLAHIVDYKTGSAKYPDVKQLKLMALMTYAHFPQVKRIKAGLLFVAHNTFIDEEYVRDSSENLWKDFLPDLQRLNLSYEHDKWPENPTPLCGWCPVTTCQFQKVR
jgi:CRISPR/Cas system-associated exonuclease Cas4 (RecB family)